MASPYLANLALGYVKQKHAQQKEAVDRELQIQDEQRKMDSTVELQKRLQQLSFDSLQQKSVVERGMNQQTNTRLAQQYETIAKTSTDPLVRKQAQKWAAVYSGAGDMSPESAETIGKNITPEKAEKVTVADIEQQRKERNEQIFQEKLGQLGDLPLQDLQKDPKLKQRTFMELSQGLDTDYLDNMKQYFDALFPKEGLEKMPETYKNMALQYAKLSHQYTIQQNLIAQGKAEEESLTSIEAEINSLADFLNEWNVTQGLPESYMKFEEEVTEEPGLIQKLTGGRMGSPNVEVTKKKTLPSRPESPQGPTVKGSKRERYNELVKLFPDKSPKELADILTSEKGMTWQ